MEQLERCDSCGSLYPPDQLIEFEGQLLCPSCYQDETVPCAHCGERIWLDDNAGDTHTPLCQSCYDHYYIACVCCGRIIHMDDAIWGGEDQEDPYCSSCDHQRRQKNRIQSYYYKPDPIFYGPGPRWYGVELEIDEAGESDTSAQQIMETANTCKKDRLYCKHDGSLKDGFELVTHPMSLDYHCREMPWKEILEEAVSMGYRSHQTTTCGLHVHVDRDAFGCTQEEQDASIARVLYFFEKHWEELLKFSRRTQHQLNAWAARYGYKDQPREILDHAKKGCHAGRYTCVNLTNSDTIEFRIFRGTLKYNTLIATLQLLDRICDVAISLSDEELKAMPWSTFVLGCQAPELIQYLKERRLYVNEPVMAEEEV